MNISAMGSPVLFGAKAAKSVKTESPETVQQQLKDLFTQKGFTVTEDFDAFLSTPSLQVMMGSRSLGINPAAGPVMIMVDFRPKNKANAQTEFASFRKLVTNMPGASKFTLSGKESYSGTVGNQMVNLSLADF